MLIFAIILTTILIVAAIVLVCFFAQKKSDEFVLQHSISLKKLKEINKQYSFYPYVNLNQTHTYDNEHFYNDVSCQDYLIYQLQYIKKSVFEQINNISINQRLYSKYLEDVNSVTTLGQFDISIEKLKLDKLLKKEKQLFTKQTLSPPTTRFALIVTLRRSDINGKIFDLKHTTFSAKEIITLVKRLENKSGSFYRDREIWDAICRVERGKISNKMRFEIYARDGHKCCNCGVLDNGNNLEIDHILPISKGGKSTYDNLQTLCHKCNKEKGDAYIKYR